MHVLEDLVDFQDGGGCHLGKWPWTPASVIFGLSMCFLVSVPFFIKIGQYLGVSGHSLDFQDGGGGHLGFCVVTSGFEFS